MRRIGVELRNLGLLTIGSAYSRLILADINTVKVGGRVIIPGSSFKGALRTAAHKAAPKIGLSSCGQVNPSKIAEAHEKMGRICDVCELFGMPGSAATSLSKLLVSDLRPREEISTVMLTKVSIDPERWKAQDISLYNIEAIPLCTTFGSEVMILDDKEKYLKLFLSALDELMYGSFGRGAVVEVRVTSEIPDFASEFEHLREWRWDICP